MSNWRSRLFAFAFVTTHKEFAGLNYGRWLRLLLASAVIISLLLLQWKAALLFLVLRITTNIIYRRAKKHGYATFTPETLRISDLPIPLPADERLPLRVTGKVSSSEKEFDVLLRPAQVWRTALYEYVLMVTRSGESYLYQFIQPDHIDEIHQGYFLFGREEYPGLKLVYHTDWSPQLLNHGLAYYVGGGPSDDRIKLTLYLTFEDEATASRLAQSLKEIGKG